MSLSAEGPAGPERKKGLAGTVKAASVRLGIALHDK